jgi:hypothetical protein
MRDDFSEEEEEEEGQPGLPWPAADPPPPPGPPSQRMRKSLLLVATALIAAGAGFLVVTAVHDLSANPASASGSPTSSPQGEPPSEGTGNGGTGSPPIPSTGPGQTLRLGIGGKVTAVSATSITLGAHGQSVTAAVTKATVVTGKVASIDGIKVGDLVSAQITGTNGKLTATAIQDPASVP